MIATFTALLYETSFSRFQQIKSKNAISGTNAESAHPICEF